MNFDQVFLAISNEAQRGFESAGRFEDFSDIRRLRSESRRERERLAKLLASRYAIAQLSSAAPGGN